MKNSVLIIDDEKSNLMYLNYILGEDYRIYTARSAEEGIKRALEYHPDLILLDIIMPGMDGYEAIAALKESEKTKEIPVIFITGLSSSEDEAKGLDLGADDYIAKPFNDAIVKLRIRNQIKIKNQTRLIIAKEIAEKSNRARLEFLSRMSHEMRTPMNAIIGMTALAQNTEDHARQKECLAKAGGAAGELLHLIDSMLDISGMEEGKFSLSPSEFDFAEMLKNIFSEAGAWFGKKQQSFETDVDPTIPKRIVCDQKRLGQVIKNLLSNAGKFTGERGAIKFRAFALEKARDSLGVQIEIMDSGIGIKEEERQKLFVAFEQLDGGIRRKYQGAGLGLLISKNIVEMMGGRIWVESVFGEGSKFAFTFRALIGTPGAEDGAPASLRGKTALLVDDVEINREIVMSMLEDTGMKIVCADDGCKAVDLFSSDPEKYDLVFMDINMPEMDGVEATRRIRTHGTPKGQRVPILAMTANTQPEEVKGYIAAGMTDHIGKPIDFGKLLDKINMYVPR